MNTPKYSSPSLHLKVYKTIVCAILLALPGITNAQFAGGDGTSGDPYQVATAAQLDSVHNYLDKYFIQTADIDLDIAAYNSGSGWDPIGDSSTKFTGSYNGDGYTISGLFINRGASDEIGLFGYASSGASVKNVGVLNVNITGRYNVGVVVGRNEGTVSTSYTTGVVDGNTYSAGLVGNNKGTITNSYAGVEIESGIYIAGLAGNNEGTITNSYSFGKINAGSNRAGLVARNGLGTVTNSYWDIETSGIATSAGGTGLNGTSIRSQSSFTGWDFTTVWNIESGSTISFPYLRDNEQTLHPGKLTIPFAGGVGSEADPYQVATAAQLDSVHDFKSAHFIQTADIDLDIAAYNSGDGWNPIGDNTAKFTGSYNGDGYTISGLFIDRNTTSNVGLFGVTDSNTEIENVALLDVDIEGQYRVGTLAGKNEGTVSSSYAIGKVDGQYMIGGLVGENGGTVEKSYTNVEVLEASLGDGYYAGLVGSNASGGTIFNSYSIGNIASSSNTYGGLVAKNEGTVTNSYWNTETSGTSTSAGGTGLNGTNMRSQYSFTGWNFTTVWNIESGTTISYPYLRDNEQNPHPGKVIIPFAAGAGTEGNPYQVTTAAQLDSVRNFTGAHFIQTANIDLDIAAYNSGNGWIPIGDNSIKFSGSYDGDGYTISGLFIDRGTTDYIGLFGTTSSSATLKNIGLLNIDVTGKYRVGAIAGTNDGTVSSSYAIGDVDGGYNSGGLVGQNKGTVEDSYANVHVKKAQYNNYGGLVGVNESGASITTSYSMGNVVSGSANYGGLVGKNSGTVTNSYWNTETSGLGTSNGGTGLTTVQMADAANFTGFDFDDVWEIDNGFSFPILREANGYVTSVLSIKGDEGWRMMSSPVTSLSFGTILEPLYTQGFTGSDYSSQASNVYTWNEATQSFESISNATDVPTTGTGFIAYVYADDDFDGTPEGFPKTLMNSGAQFTGTSSPTLSFTDSGALVNDGWNLLGNPFGASIDWDAAHGWSRTNLDATYYVWSDSANAGAGAYLSWNGITGTLENGKIAPWQGFWVKANATSPSISINDSTKNSGGVYHKSVPTPELRFVLKGNNLSSQSIIMFDERAMLDEDPFDAYKLASLNSEYLSLGSSVGSGTSMDIQALPTDFEEIEIDLNITGSDLNGEFSLSWEEKSIPVDWSIVLLDRELNTEYGLSTLSSISFELNQSKGKEDTRNDATPQAPIQVLGKAKGVQNRFALRITVETSVSNELVSNLPKQVELNQNYPNPFNPSTSIAFGLPTSGNVTLEVFDLLGRKVATLLQGENKTAGRHTINFDASRLSSGMYIYRLKAGNSAVTKKLTLIK